MSADLLREASALMRSRAEGAAPSPWWVDFGGDYGNQFALITGILREPYGDNGLNCGEDHDTAEHIASWHPAVALAVADWLDATHANLSTYNGATANSRHAFAVARAYLAT